MSYSKLIVDSDMHGIAIPLLTDGKDILIPPADVKIFTDRMIDLISNAILSREMGDRSRHTVN